MEGKKQVWLKEDRRSGGATFVNEKANVSRSRDPNHQGVLSKVNHPPDLSSTGKTASVMWSGRQRPDLGRGANRIH